MGQAAIATLLEMLSSETSSRVVVGGMPNLTRFGDEFESTVRPVLEALEEQVVLLNLLGEATTTDVVMVRIGQENPYKELQSTSVVASGYGTRLTRWRRWESSARPEWITPRPWLRSAPSRATSAGSSPKDRREI